MKILVLIGGSLLLIIAIVIRIVSVLLERLFRIPHFIFERLANLSGLFIRGFFEGAGRRRREDEVLASVSHDERRTN